MALKNESDHLQNTDIILDEIEHHVLDAVPMFFC